MDTERYPNICILLVDPDPRSSQNTLALLVNSNYRVVTACQGADALETLEKKKRKVDLVLMPTKLPDMCSFEVLDILQNKYKMAVVMLFDTDQPCAKAEYVRNGAMFCYVKPLDSRIAATLWQHAFVKEVELFRQSRRSPISGVTFNESEIHVAKRKFQGSSSFTWTPYMENIFLGIVHGLGVYDADPLEVLRRMHVPGLTLDVLIDKLQEYQVRQTFLDHSITVSPTPVCIIALNSRSQLMGQNNYTNPDQAFAHEQGYPGFLQNPRQDQLNRARAYEMPTPPLALVNSVPYLPHVPNMSQLPQASVPPANTAQRLILPPWPPTLTYLPSSSVAPPAPGHGEDESKLGG
ncbi:uncharacterized protein LOC110685362 isoform X2 [Chenopodium quinoa]|nr:uncharacterized protein LOC110685362 isoform X2 [Chenopodium quinoa]